MSRNSELLTELENDLSQTGSRHGNGVPRAAAEAVVASTGESGEAGDEEMQQLVRRVFVPMDAASPRSVVLCGIEAQNGSSTICARIARALAANDQGRVCLLDVNLRSPRLSGMFKVAPPSKAAAATTPIVEQCVRIEDNLWLTGLGALAGNRTTLPSAEELRQLLARLRSAFDYVLLDVAGTSVCGHAQVLGLVADAAILVIEANHTRRLSAKNAQQTLTAAGVRLLGTVLHNRSFPIPTGLYKRL